MEDHIIFALGEKIRKWIHMALYCLFISLLCFTLLYNFYILFLFCFLQTIVEPYQIKRNKKIYLDFIAFFLIPVHYFFFFSIFLLFVFNSNSQSLLLNLFKRVQIKYHSEKNQFFIQKSFIIINETINTGHIATK